MNLQETAALLGKIQLVDNREITEAIVREWFDLVGHVDYLDAVEGVRMFRKESPDVYLMPGHVIANVRRVAELRARALRKSRPALEPARITLDREKFEEETRAAIAAARAEREVAS